MDILKNVEQAGNQAHLFIQKKSPEILMGLGVVTFVGAIITACRATVKAVDVADEHTKKVAEVKANVPAEAEKQAVTKVYLRTGFEMAKLYAPTIVLASTSLGMMFGANHILKERNAAIASSYVALSNAYKAYRKNVVDKYGEQEDYNLLHGIKEVETEEEYVDDKGKTKTRKVKEAVVSQTGADIYTRYFKKGNVYWKNNDDLNEYEFRIRENILNENLVRKGFVSFNEALELFGFDRCDDGMVTGWIYDTKRPTGDNYILVDRHKEKIMNELGRIEDVWVLEFNVDGNIYDIMQTRKLEARRKVTMK